MLFSALMTAMIAVAANCISMIFPIIEMLYRLTKTVIQVIDTLASTYMHYHSGTYPAVWTTELHVHD